MTSGASSPIADELSGKGPRRAPIIVGGSLLAWHGLRDSTEDVDTIRHLDAELRLAIEAVAARNGLSGTWLNDHATAFAPVTVDAEHCETLAEHPTLRVLGLPLRDLFLMKLRRADPADLNDLQVLWPRVSNQFSTARHIVDAFYEAFPDEPADRHLAEFVVAELARGGVHLRLG